MENINEKIRRYSVFTFSTLIICILFISTSAAADEVIEINETIIPATDYVKQISDLKIGDELLVNVEVTGGSIDVILRDGNSDVATETIEGTGTLTHIIEYSGNYELAFENKNFEEVYLDGSIEITNTTAEAGGSGLTLTEADQETVTVEETEAAQETVTVEEEADMAAEESGPTTPGFGILTTVLAFCGLIYGLKKR